MISLTHLDRAAETDRFHTQYPRLFARRIGLECGPGWFRLLDDLFAALESQIVDGLELGEWYDADADTAPGQPFWPHALQIKEKFAGLRVYLSHSNKALEAAIDLAADVAEKTCDQCGLPGSLRNLGGYHCTRCDRHAHTRRGLP